MSASYSPKQQALFARNDGYWDGRAARDRGRFPEWASGHVYQQKHPTCKAYGVGFWAGWYGEAHPNTGRMPVGGIA